MIDEVERQRGEPTTIPSLDDQTSAPNPMTVADGGIESPIVSAALAFAPRYLALTTATVLWWSYLVLGEFVLAGVPEWFGGIIVVALGGAGYLALERRLAIYLPLVSRRLRLATWCVVGFVCGAGLFFSFILSAVLPEPVTTLLMLVTAAVLTWWKGRKRKQLLLGLQPESSPLVAIRAMLVGLMTLAAVILLVTRVSEN